MVRHNRGKLGVNFSNHLDDDLKRVRKEEKMAVIKTNKRKKRILPYLILLPSFVFLIAFAYYPFLKTIVTSFSLTTEIGEWISWAGLDNWKRVFTGSDFGRIMANTFIMAGICLVVELLIATLLALLCVREKKGSRVYQTLFSAAMVVPGTAIALIWTFIFNKDSGIVNRLLGTDWDIFHGEWSALISVSLIECWGSVAGKFLWLMAGFRNVSDELLEAARIDGAGWFTRTTRILLPMASPQIFYVVFTSIIGAFKHFTFLDLLTGGGPAGASTTLMYALYSWNRTGHPEIACVYSLLLFAVIFIATRIQLAFEKKTVFYQ